MDTTCSADIKLKENQTFDEIELSFLHSEIKPFVSLI